MPGEWFPFDGLEPSYQGGWFDKRKFVNKGSPLHRYGTELLKEWSTKIAAMDEAGEIEDIEDTTDQIRLNEFLATERCKKLAELWKTILSL